jgi:hypothetical protein
VQRRLEFYESPEVEKHRSETKTLEKLREDFLPKKIIPKLTVQSETGSEKINPLRLVGKLEQREPESASRT